MRIARLVQSDPATPPTAWLQVWLEAGREGQVFTYAQPPELAVGVGDLVTLRLRGRRHIGLVVEVVAERPAALAAKAIQPIEAIHQAAAVDPQWQALIQDVAGHCHTSAFRTLKAALPPGWLGQRPQRAPQAPRQRLWLRLAAAEPADAAELTERQQALLEALRSRGGQAPQSTLLQACALSSSVVTALVTRGWLERDWRLEGPGQPLASGVQLEPHRRLTPAQAEALAAIAAAPAGAQLLLWGSPVRARPRCTCRRRLTACARASRCCCSRRRSA